MGNGCIYTHIGEAAIGWVYIQIEMQRERSRCEWEMDRGNEMHEIRQAEERWSESMSEAMRVILT